MPDLPFTFTLPMPEVIPSRCDNHIQRRLSALKGQFLDQETYQRMLTEEDRLVYEVYEIHRPEVAGEFLMGVSIVHPGKVLYVPPRWAHRSVCTSRQEDLVTFFAYPGNAGHDYGTIERLGFRKLVVDGQNGPEIVDNPRYQE